MTCSALWISEQYQVVDMDARHCAASVLHAGHNGAWHICWHSTTCCCCCFLRVVWALLSSDLARQDIARRMTGVQNSRTRATRPQQLQQEQQQQWQSDRRIGMISIAMWLGTAFRVLLFLTFWENMQSVAAILTSKCILCAMTCLQVSKWAVLPLLL